MEDFSKLLFALISDCKKNMIAFFYLLNQIKRPLIILLSCDNFLHGGSMTFNNTNFIIDLVSIQIAIVYYDILSKIVKLVKMMYLKFVEIDLNIYSKT